MTDRNPQEMMMDALAYIYITRPCNPTLSLYNVLNKPSDKLAHKNSPRKGNILLAQTSVTWLLLLSIDMRLERHFSVIWHTREQLVPSVFSIFMHLLATSIADNGRMFKPGWSISTEVGGSFLLKSITFVYNLLQNTENEFVISRCKYLTSNISSLKHIWNNDADANAPGLASK